MRSGFMPMLAAMAGFWVTARVSRPNRVRVITYNKRPKNNTPKTKMAILMLLIANTSLTTKAPSSHEGEVSGLACVP